MRRTFAIRPAGSNRNKTPSNRKQETKKQRLTAARNHLTKQKTYDISFCNPACSKKHKQETKKRKQETKKQKPRTFQEATAEHFVAPRFKLGRPGHEREGRGGTIEECYLATWTRTSQAHSSTQPPSHAANQPPSHPAQQPVGILLQASRRATPSPRAVRHGELHWVAARLRTLVGIVKDSVWPL